MPQFDILSDPAAIGLNLVWFIVLFGLTMVIVNFGISRISAVRDKREELTSGNVDKAQALLDEAKGLMDAYEEKMAAARTEAQGVIKVASDKAADKAAKAQAKLADELTATRIEIETAIADQTKAAEFMEKIRVACSRYSVKEDLVKTPEVQREEPKVELL